MIETLLASFLYVNGYIIPYFGANVNRNFTDNVYNIFVFTGIHILKYVYCNKTKMCYNVEDKLRATVYADPAIKERIDSNGSCQYYRDV